ncbi:MAG: OmpA family protein [Thiotrichales bacterium]|nr:OmpA family protein [Thiotrichales bacterium]
MQRLAAYLKKFPEVRLQLFAHTDQRGRKDYNRKLSEKRAYAVMSHLVNAGLGNQRIYVNAAGETAARVPVSDIDGMAHERRVDVKLTLDTRT